MLIEQAARKVLEKFEEDEAAGYRSRDRQFAIELLRKAFESVSATPEGRLREVVGRILWSKVTEISGGKCYLETNLDDVADELGAALTNHYMDLVDSWRQSMRPVEGPDPRD